MDKKQILHTWKRYTILLTILLSVLIFVFSQQQHKPNEYYKFARNHTSLDSIFPIEEIKSITVTNFSGTHTLTENELAILKTQFREAKFAGGLLVKPGHIILSIELQTKTKAKPGFVYAYTGTVNFDGGINRFGERFSGTYYLPLEINFDNYK